MKLRPHRLSNLSQPRGLGAGLLLVFFVMMTLACGFLERAGSAPRSIKVARLPTLTPTPISSPSGLISPPVEVAPLQQPPVLPTAVLDAPETAPTVLAPTAPDIAAPTPNAVTVSTTTETTLPASPSNPPPTPSSSSATSLSQQPQVVNTPIVQPGSAIAFANVQMFSDPNQPGLLLYGDVLNQSGAPQELQRVTGTFVDAQGQVIAGEDKVDDYAPVSIIPTQGRVPFELSVPDIQAAANYNLRVEAQPSDRLLRQDFEITTTSENRDEYGLCVGGKLRNSGANLGEYVVLAAILYNAQNHIISFGDIYLEPEALLAGQSTDFEVCADAFSQPVSHYELRAWGQ